MVAVATQLSEQRQNENEKKQQGGIETSCWKCHFQSHLINSSKNATYLSPEIQYEIIDISGKLIQQQIVNQVNQSKYFAILGDETLDVSGIEQFSLCIWYIHQGTLREDFLSFLELYDLSGEVISERNVNKCKDLGLNLKHLIGQGYDGAANMGGKINGVQARIKQQFPKAIYVHCACQWLNLVLSHSTEEGMRSRNSLTALFCHWLSTMKSTTAFS